MSAIEVPDAKRLEWSLAELDLWAQHKGKQSRTWTIRRSTFGGRASYCVELWGEQAELLGDDKGAELPKAIRRALSKAGWVL